MLASIAEDEEGDECDDEEESSVASPAPKATYTATAKPSAVSGVVARAVAAPVVVAPVVAPPKQAGVAKRMIAAPAVPAAVPVTATQSRVPVASAPVMAAIDDVLSDPEELETYLSFVASSTDKKAAQKAGKNVAFLLKVAQFNKAAEQERPRVARAIYDEFLHARGTGAPARDQKGQVEVDVSELRKTKLVSQYQAVFEKQTELQTGFFDKAARDVEAFVNPTLNKYIEAKKTG